MTALNSQSQKFRTIDLTESLNAIRRTYGERYFAIPEAQWEAAALWGATPETLSINDCGVFTARDDVIQLQSGGCSTAITLVKAPNDYWAVSSGYHTPTSGYSYAPSIWNRQAFPSRDDALLAGLCELTNILCGTAESKCSTNSDAIRHDIRQMIALLEAEKTPQLSLF